MSKVSDINKAVKEFTNDGLSAVIDACQSTIEYMKFDIVSKKPKTFLRITGKSANNIIREAEHLLRHKVLPCDYALSQLNTYLPTKKQRV